MRASARSSRSARRASPATDVGAIETLPVDPRAALTGAYRATTAFVDELDQSGWSRNTRCEGWTAQDLLYHQLLDAQRALRTFASPAEQPCDVDFVTYWHDYGQDQDADDAAAHAEFVRRSAAAFPSARSLLGLWEETARAAGYAAGRANLGALVATQGHVLTAGDFLATVVTEAAIHHLDLTPERMADAGWTPVAALTVASLTLDGLLGRARPIPWTDAEYVLRGTGRVALAKDERSRLGSLAVRFPLIT